MIFDAARLAFGNLFSSETRYVFWKGLGLTLRFAHCLVYFALPLGKTLVPSAPELAVWFTFVFASLAGIRTGTHISAAELAGLFLDDVAEIVDKKTYPDELPKT